MARHNDQRTGDDGQQTMKNKFLGALFGGMILVGIALLTVSGLGSKHQRLLSKADTLAAEGNFAEALNTYQEVEADYGKTFLGIPQGPILDVLSPLGAETRSYLKLRRAEMEFREGERLLAISGHTQLVSLDAPVPRLADGDLTEKPSLEEVIQRFNAAEAQYKQVQGETQDPHWRFIATVNRARAMTETFLIKHSLEEQPRNLLNLRQGLADAVQSLQSVLDALYTDQIRVPLLEERNLVLLLEILTRFRQTPESEAGERQKLERLLKDTVTSSELASLGEILRRGDLTSKSLSRQEESTMKDFLPNPSPSSATFQQQGDHPPLDSPDSRAGTGSADAGNEGEMH